MHHLFRSQRPGRPEYASLILFLIAWLATLALIAMPRTTLMPASGPMEMTGQRQPANRPAP
jgi:hypothetical protein